MTTDRTPPVLVEVCVDAVESALAAEAGGADRIELCTALGEGGLTPSHGLIAACRARVRIPLFVIVRPRGGDFLFSHAELDVMRRDIAAARELGADGVVLGALRADGTVDADATARLVDAARPLAVTFHRAVDVCRDLDEALAAVAHTGADRLLTSGGAPTALEGAGAIARLVRAAPSHLAIVAGGGITEHTAAAVIARTGVREVHTRAAVAKETRMRYRSARIRLDRQPPADELIRDVADADVVRRLAAAVRRVP